MIVGDIGSGIIGVFTIGGLIWRVSCRGECAGLLGGPTGGLTDPAQGLGVMMPNCGRIGTRHGIGRFSSHCFQCVCKPLSCNTVTFNVSAAFKNDSSLSSGTAVPPVYMKSNNRRISSYSMSSSMIVVCSDDGCARSNSCR
uniref:Uncharacterized protein n=1 Tax=Panstrongylus lignarius TaxID=156445 RepID=A0A224XZK1_9HEMI